MSCGTWLKKKQAVLFTEFGTSLDNHGRICYQRLGFFGQSGHLSASKPVQFLMAGDGCLKQRFDVELNSPESGISIQNQ